jgi:hypothetical protein
MNVTARSGALNGSSTGRGPAGAGIFGTVTLCLGMDAASMSRMETIIPAAPSRESRLVRSTVPPFRELPVAALTVPPIRISLDAVPTG